MIAVLAGKIITPLQSIAPGIVLIDNGRILTLGSPQELTVPNDAAVIHAEGLTLAPGLIDLHTHGAAGCSMIDGSTDSLFTIAQFFASHGVTAFLAGIGGTHQAILAGIESVNRYLEEPRSQKAAALVGIHLEGPFINPDRAGAFTPESIVPPNLGRFLDYVRLSHDRVRLITLAPELPGQEKIIRAAVARGVTVSAGHSQATLLEMNSSIDWGVQHVTHTYNAMRPLNHREPGILGAALYDDRLSAEIIADGIHVHPAAVRLLVRAKGVDRVCLITDSVGAAGLPDGRYVFEEQNVVVADHSVRLEDGTLCGSMLTMERGVQNLVAFGAATLPQALAMGSRNPAHVIGLEHKGLLAPGKDADLIAFDENGEISWTMAAGQVVYSTITKK